MIDEEVRQTEQCTSFFFNDTATTEIYTLSLHDALPISVSKLYARSTALDLVSSREKH